MMLLFYIYLLISAYFTGNATSCKKEKLDEIGKVTIWQEAGYAIFFESGMAVDADGSPRAYHPDNIGLDDLQHAGKEWEGIAHDEKGPIIQGPHDPAPGYYVSQTSLEHTEKAYSDPARYINAEGIPYFVLPASLAKKANIKLGDVAVIWNRQNDWFSYAIYADTGPEGKIGEGSIALAERIGVNPNPRNGGTDANIIYIIFPGSGNGEPLSLNEIEKNGKELMNKWGGFEKAGKCLN